MGVQADRQAIVAAFVGPAIAPPSAGRMASGPVDDHALHSYLDFLSDDLLGLGNDALDPRTLAAASAADPGELHARRKRLKAEQSSHSLPAAGSPDGEGDDDGDDSDDDEPQAGRKPGGRRRAAAANKACREKARREKINDRWERMRRLVHVHNCNQLPITPSSHAAAWHVGCRFTELALLIEPGKEPKTDKLSILGEAIRFVRQMAVENSQLKQLNKFLEVRACLWLVVTLARVAPMAWRGATHCR